MPAVGLEQLGAEQRAQRATDEVAGDVASVEAVARFRAQGNHRILVAHVHQLHGQIQQQHADQQRHQRGLREAQRYPGQQQGQQADRGTQRPLAAVCQAAGPVGRQRASGASQAEQADHGV
ncbi:hypothetical protein D3C72_1586900 [compost metagenome]